MKILPHYAYSNHYVHGLGGCAGSGLIAISVVLQTAGLPLETVGLLAGVDRILNVAVSLLTLQQIFVLPY